MAAITVSVEGHDITAAEDQYHRVLEQLVHISEQGAGAVTFFDDQDHLVDVFLTRETPVVIRH